MFSLFAEHLRQRLQNLPLPFGDLIGVDVESLANCASVLSSRNAARTTRALNSAENCRLFCVIVSWSFQSLSTYYTRKQLHLKPLSSFWDTLTQLGPGLLESAYENCLSFELTCANLKHSTQKELPIDYKNVKLDCGYRVDILIENDLIVELKSVDRLLPIHEAQLLTYMKLANIKVGLLINFNVPRLKEGIKRFVL